MYDDVISFAYANLSTVQERVSERSHGSQVELAGVCEGKPTHFAAH